MCGIGFLNEKIDEVFEKNMLRGSFSFGAASKDFLVKTKNLDFFKKVENFPLIFQFRTPTIEVKDFNFDENPPFYYKNWVWVANTTSNSSWWQREKEKWEVKNDAYVLGRLFLENRLEEYNGVYSLIIWNLKENNVFCAVNGYNLYFLNENLSSVKINENWQALEQGAIFKLENGKWIKIKELENEENPWF